MKKIVIAWLLMSLYAACAWATDGCCQQRMSEEEFRAKQKAFIMEVAGLTEEEAAKFFPVYFELQDRKKQLNDEAWKLLRQGKEENVSEERYAEILEQFHDARIAVDRLEKTYFEKFRKLISCKKLYQVKKAEMHFQRNLVKGMHKKGGGKKGD
ncbi:MAG: hypothetical protein IJ511_03255 [Bacteroides sp.]|nr:hypothetical protein [Bacteroides sp.]